MPRVIIMHPDPFSHKIVKQLNFSQWCLIIHFTTGIEESAGHKHLLCILISCATCLQVRHIINTDISALSSET